MAITVALTPGEVLVGATIAAQRQLTNREAGTLNLQNGSQAVMTSELVGVFGELGVARIFNVYPDLSLNLRSGGADMTFGNLLVDVKSTRYREPRTVYVDRKATHSDVYILASVDTASVTALGYLIHKLDLHAQYARPDGKGWEVPADKLRPIEKLLAWANGRREPDA